mmetsp:Transcript_13960/g.26270  ORF Transcript_13960/g.26270 Transcript_13960/m.26270 type:complete len:523 (-) Transcript_13960:2503-4071(-)
MDQLFQKIDPSNLATTIASGDKRGKSSSMTIKESNNSTEEQEQTKRLKLSPSFSPDSKNQYKGWTVPHDGFLLPTIQFKTNKDFTSSSSSSSSSITPQDFFQNYINQRRPVVINGIPSDLHHILKWTDNEYLISKAGNESVMVEERKSSNDSFGQGNEVSMSFDEFVKLVQEGDDRHYLTTQDVQANEDGRPDLMASFMKVLQDDFPLRPHLMGHLIPQNINLWMGNNNNTKAQPEGEKDHGTSSGLHHDYHDNLYIVLRGKKKFRLYGPNDTELMYTRGKLAMVHPNGRINYEGEMTTAYGADWKADSAARASRAKDEAEKKLLEAEEAVREGKAGAQEMLERAEAMMEDAMEALIDAEVDSGDDECDDDDGEEDDGDGEDDDDEEDDESDIDFGGGNQVNTEEEDEDEVDKGTCREPRLVDKTVKNPNNFSIVDPSLLVDNDQELQEKYPLLQQAKSAFCEVQAGQMLYLPASWFHEVRSFGCEGGHLAVNYWFHPPDASDFERPYSSDFWPNDYRERFM